MVLCEEMRGRSSWSGVPAESKASSHIYSPNTKWTTPQQDSELKGSKNFGIDDDDSAAMRKYSGS